MEFLILFVVLIVGIHWGWTAREAVAKRKADLLLSQLQQMEEDESEVIRITIEKDNDILFVYHEQDSRFITQATSREELENKLKEMFPGKRFGCSEETLKKCGFIS